VGVLVFGVWGFGPKPQSPIPNPQSPIPNPHKNIYINTNQKIQYNLENKALIK
jgi:hypothetical protein